MRVAFGAESEGCGVGQVTLGESTTPCSRGLTRGDWKIIREKTADFRRGWRVAGRMGGTAGGPKVGCWLAVGGPDGLRIWLLHLVKLVQLGPDHCVTTSAATRRPRRSPLITPSCPSCWTLWESTWTSSSRFSLATPHKPRATGGKEFFLD